MNYLETKKRYVVKIRFPFSVNSFSQIAKLTATLRYVDNHVFDYDKEPPIKINIKNARARIITFHVGSPPEMTLLANPGWLALLVAILGQYRNIKSNLPEIIEDVNKVIESIKGISRKEKEELLIGVRLIIYDMYGEAEKGIRSIAEELDSFEEQLHDYADVLARKRYDLMGRWRDLPEIEVISLDDE